jgi:hypothetical protein
MEPLRITNGDSGIAKITMIAKNAKIEGRGGRLQAELEDGHGCQTEILACLFRQNQF